MGKAPYLKLYKSGSNPLEEADKVKIGELVYTSSGKCYVCAGEDESGNSVYEHVHDSELIDGETLEGIAHNSDLLTIFWKLSEKRLNKTNYAS